MHFAADTSKARSFVYILEDACSADADLGVGDELVGRNGQVGRRRALTDTARGVVDRAMARAEEAIVLALMSERDAAEVCADANQHQPLVVALLDPRGVRLRVRQGL